MALLPLAPANPHKHLDKDYPHYCLDKRTTIQLVPSGKWVTVNAVPLDRLDPMAFRGESDTGCKPIKGIISDTDQIEVTNPSGSDYLVTIRHSDTTSVPVEMTAHPVGNVPLWLEPKHAIEVSTPSGLESVNFYLYMQYDPDPDQNDLSWKTYRLEGFAESNDETCSKHKPKEQNTIPVQMDCGSGALDENGTGVGTEP
jgi:hypothetical protein